MVASSDAENKSTEEKKRQSAQSLIPSRWLYTLQLPFFGLHTVDYFRDRVGISWHLLSPICFLVMLTLTQQAWRERWRQKYPEGMRLVLRYFSKTDAGLPQYTEPTEDGTTWPPPPKRRA